VEVPQVAAAPISANVPDAEQQQIPATTSPHGSATPTQSAAAADSTLVHGQNLQLIFEQEEDEDSKDEQEAFDHPRLRQTIQQDHPVDNILGSLHKGVLTRSLLTNFF
jgi:hypothetical protein